MKGAALAILAWLLLCAGCGPGGPSSNEAPTGEPPTERIVVLSPALGVTIADLGLADRVVGRHGWDPVIDPGVPVCGDQSALDYEAIVRARPTHVLTEWGSRDLPKRLLALASRHGWHVEDFSVLTLEDIASVADRLEAMFPNARAPADGPVAGFRALVGAPEPEPVWQGRVLVLMSASPIAALGPGSAHHDLLARVGGVQAIREGSPHMTLHAEDLVRLAPDALILIRAEAPGAGEDPFGPLRRLDIPALREGRIEVVSGEVALLPSPRLVLVADAMRAALERWAGDP